MSLQNDEEAATAPTTREEQEPVTKKSVTMNDGGDNDVLPLPPHAKEQPSTAVSTTCTTTNNVNQNQQATPHPATLSLDTPLHSSNIGMESSVLKFSNVNFTVGTGDKKKFLLTNVNATVRWGRVLASTWEPLVER